MLVENQRQELGYATVVTTEMVSRSQKSENQNPFEKIADLFLAAAKFGDALVTRTMLDVLSTYETTQRYVIKKIDTHLIKLDNELNKIGKDINQITEAAFQEIISIYNEGRAQVKKLDRVLHNIGEDMNKVIMLVLGVISGVAKSSLQLVNQFFRSINLQNLKHLVKRMEKPQIHEGIEMRTLSRNVAQDQ